MCVLILMLSDSYIRIVSPRYDVAEVLSPVKGGFGGGELNN